MSETLINVITLVTSAVVNMSGSEVINKCGLTLSVAYCYVEPTLRWRSMTAHANCYRTVKLTRCLLEINTSARRCKTFSHVKAFNFCGLVRFVVGVL